MLALDCASDHAAVMTPTVRRMTATIWIREYFLPYRLPAIMVVILPPERRMICTGTDIS